MDISSIFSSQNSVNQLISQYMSIEERPRDLLITKRNSLDNRKSILSELDSKLAALKNKADRMMDPIFNYFAAKKATSSDIDKVTVNAGSSASLGNHSISVERLAESDTRVSQQYNSSDSDFTSYSTDQTFYIEVAHPTEDDPNNRIQIDVTIAGALFAEDNETVLQGIADAINTAMSNAVTDETVEIDEIIHASVVNEESGTTRLVFRTEQSGYGYRMDFGSSTLLDDLQVNLDSQSSGTAGGYITYVGTDETNSLLNSKFSIDGLTFYRNSNSVTDAINGVTLQLLNTFAANETITVTADLDSVKNEVQGFLDTYNEAISYLREKTQIDPNTYLRGPLSDDMLYRNIFNELREIASSEVAGTSSQVYTKLYNIGIEADLKGRLSIKDAEKFNDAVETNSIFVSDLFNSADGIATQVENYIDDFVKAGGTIDSSKNNIEDEISLLNDRIKLANDLLSIKESKLRNEFSKLQEMMVILSNQQSFFSSLISI